MAKSETVEVSPSHIRYVAGYGLTSMWATMLLFSTRFGQADPTAVVTLSMLSGLVACVLALVMRGAFSRVCGRTPFIAICAVGMAVGTLLCTLPVLNSSSMANAIGVALSGLCAMPILLAWFTEFCRLPGRCVVLLGGCSLLFSALLCFALSNCPQQVAAALMGAAPLLSFALLPANRLPGEARPPAGASPAKVPTHPLGMLLSQAVSWRTLLGIAVVFFVMGSLGVAAPRVDLFHDELSPVLLLYPAALSAFFVGSAYLVRRRIDASILYKVLLVALAGLLFALVFMGRASISYIFYTYITCDVLLWTVLVLASKQTPVEPFVVFIAGWLAECVGNVLGHNVSAMMADTTAFAAVTGLLIVVAIGFAFSEGMFMLDLEEGDFGPSDAVPGRGDGLGEGEPASPPSRPLAAGGAGGADSDDHRAEAPDAARGADSGGVGEVVSGAGQSAASDAVRGSVSDSAPGAGLDANRGAVSESVLPAAQLAAPSGSSAQEPASDPVSSFVQAHGLSRREAEVFALWVTGHGLKYIQETLFISESTVKTHMRSIYRKCDVHNRAEIIDLYERESASGQAR